MLAANSNGGPTNRRPATNTYLKWFRLVVWLGILVNLSFAVPAVFAPSWLLTRMNLPLADQTIWLRDAGMLLFFLSTMYIPAARDPGRYTFNAVFAVIARLVFAVFWLVPVLGANAPLGYLFFGLVDLSFGLGQASLLLLLQRKERYIRGEEIF